MVTALHTPPSRLETLLAPPALPFRQLKVTEVEPLTEHYVRIRTEGDLEDFVSLGADDHVALFFPDPETGLLLEPEPGLIEPQDVLALKRDFTPRRFDAAQGWMEFEFALHGSGIASMWAHHVVPGELLGMSGIQRSSIVTYDFDWYLLMGDETAIPAIARHLEQLPAGAHAMALIEVEDEQDELHFDTEAALDLRWAHRSRAGQGAGESALLDALRALTFPPGEGFVFAATEAAEAHAISEHLIEERGVPRDHARIRAYWKKIPPERS